MERDKENVKVKPTWTKVIDWLLIISLIVIVVFSQVDGKYIKKEVRVVEVCNGLVENEEDIEWLKLNELIDQAYEENYLGDINETGK